MYKKRIALVFVVLGIGLLSAGSANADVMVAALGGRVVFDKTANLSWLADANLAATNTFGVSGINADGSMTWDTAQTWIAAMDAAKYLGFSDWRLPASDTCFGYNCTGSEMGNLFYNGLGGVAGQDIATTHNANYGLFQNIQSGVYWSGTAFASLTTNAWLFNTAFESQYASTKSSNLFALAVRPAPVTTVPEPDELALFASGLCLIGFVSARRSRFAEAA